MHISWFHDDDFAKGRLGMTHSPGAKRATLFEDLEELEDQGVGCLICFQQGHELPWTVPGDDIEKRARAVADYGMAFTHCPIRDGHAPSDEQATEVVAHVLEELAAGLSVVLHCHAGLGRAGTLAACVFIAKGLSAKEAIDYVREVRPGAIQTSYQEDFLRRFAIERQSGNEMSIP